MHGPGEDEPLVWYEGSGTTNKRWLYADHLGSIVATANGAGTSTATYSYGPYGEPNVITGSRFRYTGQQLMGQLNLYYYKARFYSPTLGRFLQTDPIGYADDMNLYAYVGNDPVNRRDPGGLSAVDVVMLSGRLGEGGVGFTGEAMQVVRADVNVWPRQGGGFNYRATDDRGNAPLQGTFNTETSLNINQLHAGDYRVTPRPIVPEPGLFGQIHDIFMGSRNQNAGNPTISNTANWNQVQFPDGSIHEGIQIHPGRQGTAGGNSLGCLVCTQAQFDSLNNMFNLNYLNGGVFLHVLPQAPKQ